MIPVNGKPVIGWILDDLEQKGFQEVVIVLQFDNQKLYNYVHWTYSGRLDVHFAYVQPHGSILHSLLAGLSWIVPEKSVYVVLGDTLIEDAIPEQQTDFLYTGTYDEPENWCLAQGDEQGALLQLFDKIPVQKSGLSALAGAYSFSRTDLLRSIIIRQIQQQKKELSAAIEAYHALVPMQLIRAEHWYDFGHISGFNQAKQTLLQSRFFNSLAIDPVRGVITKTSSKIEKLADELNWYHQLPESLQIFAPRILSHENKSGKVEIVQEFYGYPNLAELYVFGDLNLSVWKNALRQLMQVHEQFRTYTAHISLNDLENMYRHKTFERLNSMKQSPEWSELLLADQIQINGKWYDNLPVITPVLNEYIDQLVVHQSGSIIHGDYCFSNILYDLNTQIIRLIDPRGSFGQKGIYGDPRYDMAKLRHSVSGLYDFILADLFRLEKTTDTSTYHFEVFSSDYQETLTAYFDELLSDYDYYLDEIILIEALLFLSMIPYHEGKSSRQLAMYLTGILLIHQLFENENSNRLRRHNMPHQTATSTL